MFTKWKTWASPCCRSESTNYLRDFFTSATHDHKLKCFLLLELLLFKYNSTTQSACFASTEL